jgi:hypothetical protein
LPADFEVSCDSFTENDDSKLKKNELKSQESEILCNNRFDLIANKEYPALTLNAIITKGIAYIIALGGVVAFFFFLFKSQEVYGAAIIGIGCLFIALIFSLTLFCVAELTKLLIRIEFNTRKTPHEINKKLEL